MAIRIELSPEVEERLREEAARNGKDVNSFAQSLVEEGLGSGPGENGGVSSAGQTLDKVLAGHIGLIDAGPSERPEKTGDPFTDGLIYKYRKQGLTV